MAKIKMWRFLQNIALVYLFMGVSALQASQWVLDISYQFETGDYSEDSETEVTTIPVLLKFYTDVWSYGIEIPYLSVTGIDTVIPGSNGQFIGPGKGANNTVVSSSRSVTRSGLGDMRVSVSRAVFPQQSDGLFFEITVTAKLATADENKNLGTGENDYSVKLAFSSNKGHWTPGLTVGYQLTGDTDETDFNDVFFASIGTGYKLSRDSSMGVGYDFQQSVTDGVDDFGAITVDYSKELSRSTTLGIAIKKGVTDNSLDTGLSFSASFSF